MRSFLTALRLNLSARLMRWLLGRLPNEPTLLARMGLIELNLGKYDEAVDYLERSLKILPNEPYVHLNLARALEGLDRGKDALKSYSRALALYPDFEEARDRRKLLDARLEGATGRQPAATGETIMGAAGKGKAFDGEAAYLRAVSLHEKGRSKEAASLYERILKAYPDHAHVMHMLGVIALQGKDYARGIKLMSRAIDINPGVADFHCNLGLAMQESSRFDEALASYDRALGIRPDFVEPLRNRGAILTTLKRFGEALYNYDQAIALKPDLADVHVNRAFVLHALRLWAAALEACDKAIALKPDYAGAWRNRGIVLVAMERQDEALASYDKAIALEPDVAESHINRAVLLKMLFRFDEALESFEKARRLQPNLESLHGDILGTRLAICLWDNEAALTKRMLARVKRRERAMNPFVFLSLSDSPPLARTLAEVCASTDHPPREFLGETPIRRARKGRKIRVGYYSADFHRHATTYLMAGVFEHHDKSRFELTGFNFDPQPDDDMRQRVAASFDHFVDVYRKSEEEICRMSREMEIDIAIDLKGYTASARTDIFAMRAAPIQVNYLGFPGTMGASYMDYLIADPVLVREGEEAHYAEKIAWLPHSYQPNDSMRGIADRTPSREEAGLPPGGFVFCSFSNNFKIQPVTFDIWMRLLKAIEGSVLWLIEDNSAAGENLRKEAGARGIDPARLVFATRIPLAEHLARHRLADLFIDTFPYNAHTTASDALWAGLPMVTMEGQSFASRVAASLLHAIGLPELITSSAAQYEALVLQLATQPEQLDRLRKKLASQRLTAPLFDTARYTRHLEAAYEAMVKRQDAGLPPEHIRVPA